MNTPTPFYITTPIYYVNAKPHLGHAYTTIVADVASRFHKMLGEETFFLTGTDEHGDKIVQAAENEGVSPRDYVDRISRLFREMWPRLDIENNAFIRTTDPDHMKVVQGILRKIYDQGDIYFDEYEGLYCFGCERFYTDRELVDGQCPDHQKPPEKIKESNYFFKMSRYQDWLVGHIRENPDFIRPERYRNEALSFLSSPLEDLCISRPKERLEWGIPLPFDDKYVTYVWFDALINYVSALGYPDGGLYRKFWPVAQHIVAKDILKPHGIYWPCMLKAAGIPVYRHLNVHGYWNVDQSKMSKSVGNVVEPLEMKNRYGTEAFRFFLMRDMVFGLDANFNEAAIVSRINADLANDLGNLFSRVFSMVFKYFKGVVPEADSEIAARPEHDLKASAAEAIASYKNAMTDFKFHKGLEAVWGFINRLNKYIDTAAPWALAKDESATGELKTVIYQLLEGIRLISGLIFPVMPRTALKMHRLSGLESIPPLKGRPFYHMDRLSHWGELKPGTQISRTKPLFPRIDPKKNMDRPSDHENEPATVRQPVRIPPVKPEISMADFEKIDLRVGTVIEAGPIPKADKLLKLTVDLGNPRTLVAGIAKQYKPDELVGRQVIVVSNLKPAGIMGVTSEGMVLAVISDDHAGIATMDQTVPPGSVIK